MGKWILKNYKDSGYMVLFDKENGIFIREGIDHTDPLWNKTDPELLDISITNYCEKECSFCYRVSNKEGMSMSVDDYEYIIQQASQIGVLQVALGGGNPNQHLDFIKILELTKKYDIIPSYTTNGQGMTDEIYQATMQYCGAMAISWYPPYKDVITVISKCKSFGIKINIHIMLNCYTINNAIELIDDYGDLLNDVNAIVFLNYKPIHSTEELILRKSDKVLSFIERVIKISACKVGFDSCMISFLASFSNEFWEETVEYCEAGRFSAFISEDFKLYPCSFFKDAGFSGIDLKKASLYDGWKEGKEFVNIRKMLNSSENQMTPIENCKSCKKYYLCHGGCQIFDINACKEEL